MLFQVDSTGSLALAQFARFTVVAANALNGDRGPAFFFQQLPSVRRPPGPPFFKRGEVSDIFSFYFQQNASEKRLVRAT